jgi:2-oxoglutarate ferredoxin oxidoreductase subunit delta
MEASEGVSVSPVQVDLELCKACGVCVELCPEKVFDRARLGEPIVARPDDCSQCLICELHCPDFAIEVRRRAKKAAKATAAPPELSRDALVAATGSSVSPAQVCDHDSEG